MRLIILACIALLSVSYAQNNCDDPTYGQVIHGATAYAACLMNYDGYRSAVCNNGVMENENLAHCTLRTVSVFSYGMESVSFMKGSEISTLNLRTDAQFLMYGIAPTLPVGLSFNTANGGISGTPTEATPAADYIITGTNGDLIKTVTLNIEITQHICVKMDSFNQVIDGQYSYSSSECPTGYQGRAKRFCDGGQFGNIEYDECLRSAPVLSGSTSQTVYRNERISTITITGQNIAADTTWGISPSLPTGLEFNKGTITGTPTTPRDSASTQSYTITATNPSATPATATVTITIKPARCKGLKTSSADPIVVESDRTLSVPCPEHYNGNAARLCHDGVYGDINISTCYPSKPTNFQYGISSYDLHIDDEFDTKAPYVTGIVDSFTCTPPVNSNFVFNTTTGALSGKIMGEEDAGTYVITAKNSATSATTTISISVTDRMCSSMADFYTIEVGKSRSYDCKKDGYQEMKMTRKCVNKGGQAMWELPDVYCEKNVDYTFLFIGIGVFVICLIILFIGVCVKNSRSRSKNTKSLKTTHAPAAPKPVAAAAPKAKTAKVTI